MRGDEAVNSDGRYEPEELIQVVTKPDGSYGGSHEYPKDAELHSVNIVAEEPNPSVGVHPITVKGEDFINTTYDCRVSGHILDPVPMPIDRKSTRRRCVIPRCGFTVMKEAKV